MNPDTGTYLASGFKPETPFDRPITYGLLIRLFSLNGLSLWLLVFVQAYIVSWLLFRIIKHLTPGAAYLLKALAIVFFLSIGTSLSWIVSQVQPDLFTSVGFLCVAVILLDKESKATFVSLYVLFLIAMAAHMSHPLLFFGTLASLFILKRCFLPQEAYRKANKQMIIMALLAAASISTMGAALSKSKHVFFVGSLLEKGVLKIYLDENCAAKDYKICAYKDVLPVKADEFWWDTGSPLYKVGDWKGTKVEFNDIIHSVLTTPRYQGLFVSAVAKQAGQQALAYNIGDGNVPFPTGSNVNERVASYFPGEIRQFNAARQNTSSLWDAVVVPNLVFTVVLMISIMILIAMLFMRKRMFYELRLVSLVCLVGVLYNCLDCAAFGIVNGRYGCKMIWLIPFCAILALPVLFRKMNKAA